MDFNPSGAVAEKDFEENYGEYDRVTLEYEPEDNTEYGYNYDDEDEEEAKWQKQKHAEELGEESDTSDDGSNCSLYWIKKSRGTAVAKPALFRQINDVYRRMLGIPIWQTGDSLPLKKTVHTSISGSPRKESMKMGKRDESVGIMRD